MIEDDNDVILHAKGMLLAIAFFKIIEGLLIDKDFEGMDELANILYHFTLSKKRELENAVR